MMGRSHMVSVDMLGSQGIVKDIPPVELGVNVWSGGLNIRMHEGFAQKSLGYQDAFSSDPAIAPLGLIEYKTPAAIFWVYSGLDYIYAHDGATEADITRVSGVYTGTILDKWNGGEFGGVLILNNGVDVPQYWTGSLGTPCLDFGAEWPSTLRARVIRPYKTFLMAGNITKSSVEYPYLVKWSDAAETGSLPSSWDETDPTTLAGEKQLRNRGGEIVDFFALDDINIVYKEGSMIAQTFIGGDFVFGWRDITNELGIFAQNTIRNFTARDNRSRSFVFGAGDVVVHDGRGLESVINYRMRRWLYNSIDATNYQKCFTAVDQERRELWCCFPESGHTWPNLALVWNWDTGAFGIEEIPDLSVMDFGFFDSGTAPKVYDDRTTEIYDDSFDTYRSNPFNPTSRSLLSASYANTKLYEYNEGASYDGGEILTYVERESWGFLLDRYGKPYSDTETYKLCTELYPRISGQGCLQVYVGRQQVVQDAVDWVGPFPFTVGVDKKVNPWVGGNLLSFRFECSGVKEWKLMGFDVKITETGTHW